MVSLRGKSPCRHWTVFHVAVDLADLTGVEQRHVEDGPHIGVHGHVLPHACHLLRVDGQTVLLDSDVLVQGRLGLLQPTDGVFGALELELEQLDGVLNFLHFLDEPLKQKSLL